MNNPCGLWCLKMYFQVRSIEAIGHMKFSRNKTKQEKHEQCYPSHNPSSVKYYLLG